MAVCGCVVLHWLRPPYNVLGKAQAQTSTCALTAQEDPYNAIAAGALTGGFLQLRHGLKSAAKSAAFGGFLLVRGFGSNPVSL